MTARCLHDNKVSRLLATADRAATHFGCDLHHLLRSSTAPPKVQEADVAFHSPHERCSSRVLEEAIAKTRTELARALANVLLAGLWEESARRGGSSESSPSANARKLPPTPPSDRSHLVMLAARAAADFGCDLHLLLRSSTPPKVQEADVAFHSPPERCSSRVLEEAIAKIRAALAQALANALLEGLWEAVRRGPGGAGSTQSTCRAEAKPSAEPMGGQSASPRAEPQPNPPHCSLSSSSSSSSSSPPDDGGLLIPPPQRHAEGEPTPPSRPSFLNRAAGIQTITVPRTTAVVTFCKASRDAGGIISATSGGAVPLANDLPIEFSPTAVAAADVARPTAAGRAADSPNRWVLSGRYEFIRRLTRGAASGEGGGGGGGLWQVSHLTTGQALAIKTIPRETLERRRFRGGRSRALMRLFQHSNLIPLLEFIDDPNCNNVFLVMPLAKPLLFSLSNGTGIRPLVDPSTGHLVTAEGPPVDTILSYAKAAASALSTSHAAGIVHGDIKLENLMLLPRRSSTERDSLVVMGFGVCQVSVSQDRTGGFVALIRGGSGTLAYWAPECFAAKKQSDTFTAASDCYALGLCLYAMAFGQFPYWTPDVSNPLAWEKVVPGTARYEGPSVRVTVPTIQATPNHTVLCNVIQRLLAPVAERTTAKNVVEQLK